MKESFEKRLEKALSIRNVSQSELARKLNIHRATVNNYITGKHEPNRDRIDEIAKILNINPTWLLGYDVDIEKDDKNEEFTPKFKILARNFEKLDEKNKNTILKMIEVMIEEEDDNPYGKEK